MNTITIRTVINGYVLDTSQAENCYTSAPRVFETLSAVVAFLDDKLERPIEGPDAENEAMPSPPAQH
jgi:hypothetical protein